MCIAKIAPQRFLLVELVLSYPLPFNGRPVPVRPYPPTRAGGIGDSARRKRSRPSAHSCRCVALAQRRSGSLAPAAGSCIFRHDKHSMHCPGIGRSDSQNSQRRPPTRRNAAPLRRLGACGQLLVRKARLAVHGLRSCRSPFFLPGAKFSAFFLLALSRAQSFTAQAWTIRTALRPVAWMASLPETRRSSAQALQAAEKPRRLIHPPRRVCTRSLVLMGRPKRRCTVTWRRMAADGRSPFC
jgi:hypothetical protein